MTRVAITQSELDSLAESIGVKAERRLPLTIDEMKEAVDGIETLNLQAVTVEPSESQQVIEPDSQHNGLSSVTVNAAPLEEWSVTKNGSGTTTYTPTSGYYGMKSVSVYTPSATLTRGMTSGYTTSSGVRKWRVRPSTNTSVQGVIPTGIVYGEYSYYNAVPANTIITPTTSTQTIGGNNYMMEGAVTIDAVPTAVTSSNTDSYYHDTVSGRKWTKSYSVSCTSSGYVSASSLYDQSDDYDAIASGTTVTPTESAQTIGGADTMMEGAVTVNAIPSNYVGSGITQRTSSDLTASGATITAPAGYYSSAASKSIASGSVSASATKGTVNNHAISVTPTATVGTAGYLAASSTNGTAVSVSASELVSGTYTVSGSGTADVTNYASASVAAGSATASATKGSVSNHSVAVTPSVTRTAGWVTAGSANGTAVSVSASELVSGTYSVTSSGTKDVTNYASASVPSGSLTVSASKGTVSNHSVSVTPSVTVGTAGFVSSGANGTAVTVSASELVSGNLAITENGTNIDCSNYATCSVSVSGGGGSSAVYIDSMDASSYTSNSLTFTGLQDEPTSFAIVSTSGRPTGDSDLTGLVYDGSAFHGQYATTQAEAISTGFSMSYNNGTLVVTSANAVIPDDGYNIVYSYGGGSNSIVTEDVQVGSGATSITFTGLADEPKYWSCIFKSNFSTSSGYQRVIAVVHNGSDTYGMEMDSSAKFSQQHWSYSYSNGSLTISSQGTNAGGYFHQPGYYQLTAAIEVDETLQQKTVTPTTSQQIVTADAPYEALSRVTVNPIPSSYVEPTTTVGATTYRASTSSQTINAGTYHSAAATIAAVTQTNLTAANIKSGTTISISNGQSNLWSVTGTYTGGGGGGSASVASTTWTNSTNTTTSHQFTGLSGTPIAAFLRCTSSLSRSSSSSNYFIADMVWDGNSCKGNSYRRSNGNYANVTSGYSVTTGSNSITFTSSGTSTTNPGSFYNGTYELVYVY